MEGNNAAFDHTRWSLVALAAQDDGRDSEVALNEICQLYWPPLYAWLRRTGRSAVEAEDITQGFLAWFVEKRHFGKADPDQGKLRSFMLGCLKNFVTNQYRKEQTQKRGGGITHVSIDQESVEGRMHLEHHDGSDPDLYFDRHWARSVFEIAMGRLREFFEKKGELDRYEVLRPFLTGENCGKTFAQVGSELAISEGAAKGIVHRMRERFKELLTQEVRETLVRTDDANIDAELSYLLHVLSAA